MLPVPETVAGGRFLGKSASLEMSSHSRWCFSPKKNRAWKAKLLKWHPQELGGFFVGSGTICWPRNVFFFLGGGGSAIGNAKMHRFWSQGLSWINQGTSWSPLFLQNPHELIIWHFHHQFTTPKSNSSLWRLEISGGRNKSWFYPRFHFCSDVENICECPKFFGPSEKMSLSKRSAQKGGKKIPPTESPWCYS